MTSLNLLHAVIKDQTITLNGDGAIPEGACLVVYGEPLDSIQIVSTNGLFQMKAGA